MGDEEIAEYALALRELKVNSKPVITSLTMLAGEIAGGDAGAAATVAGMVERHIRTAAPKTKLTGFYLLDSISKNVKGHFVACFARNLPDLFLGAFATQDESTRKSMARLLSTWNAVFPQTTLGAIARGLPPGAAGSSSGAFRTGAGALPPPPNAAGAPMNAAAAGSLLASMVQGGGDVSALLKSIAAAKLDDPDLTPAMVAARAGVSVRTLHRAFQASGETFWNWIRDRRLDRCYAELTTPIQSKRTITEVAFRWGFNELSTFDRNFRKRYGASPRNVRARAGGEAQAT